MSAKPSSLIRATTPSRRRSIITRFVCSLANCISDFNVQGKAFGPKELDDCIRRGVIHILDDATIETMKERYAERKQRDEALRQAEAVADGEVVDWQEVQRQWNEYYGIESE